jgi:uncharacterized protein YndB with AHSA1/START domain
MPEIATPTAARIVTPPAEPVILLDRVIDAPRELVFRMYADPVHLVQFWGPHGSTTSISEFEFRVGGVWRMLIRFPAGFEVPMNSIFEEIDPPRRIAFRDLPDAATGALPPHRMRVTTDFGDEGGRTRLTVTVRFATLADRDEAIAHGFTTPITESFDRLEALLAG